MAMTMFELKHKEHAIKMRHYKRRTTNHDDRIYRLLISMRSKGPITIWKVTQTKETIKFLIDKKLVKETDNNDDYTGRGPRRNIKYYIVSSKGLEYIRIYEDMQKLSKNMQDMFENFQRLFE